MTRWISVFVLGVLLLLCMQSACQDYNTGPCYEDGLASCAGECVDLQNDDNHCGLCGNACVEDAYCAYGMCRCELGYTDCNGACTNLNRDAENCGQCGNVCDSGGGCIYGICVSGGDCTEDIDCDDGNACTANDLCVNGFCTYEMKDCSALDDQCNDGVCDDMSGECITYSKPNGTPCDDGDPITCQDECLDGLCVPTVIVDCGCSGQCEYEYYDPKTCDCYCLPIDGGRCDDGDPCTHTDVCSDGFCVGTPYSCDDEDVCTDNICNGDGTCTNINNTSPCDDGDPCTHNDMCYEGICFGLPVDIYCSDECLTGHCDPDTGELLCIPREGPCEDGDGCTVNDQCENGACLGGTLRDDDGDGHAPTDCGGEDCDDSLAEVNPDQQEGPEGDPTCEDWLDNDCDGDTDEEDQICLTPVVCTESGWCWQNPLPSGDDLRSVWAASSDDIWAVGNMGLVLHWDGTEWTRIDLGVSYGFKDVWGFSSDNVWIVGRGGIYHWNGLIWSRHLEEEEYLESIWGSDPDDIWAVGQVSTIVHWDGVSWSRVGVGFGNGIFYSVGGTSSDDVWIVGGRSNQNVTFHWDGTRLTSFPTGGQGYLGGVWAMSPNDVWAGAGKYVPSNYEDTLFHWDGTSWSPADGIDSEIVTDIWATATDNVYAVGHGGGIYYWDGTVWTHVFNTEGRHRLDGISGVDEYDIWIVGANGTRLHWDGVDWSYSQTITTSWLNSIWGSSPNDVWSVGNDGTITNWDGNGWISVDSGTSADLFALWGSGSDDIWAVGSYILLHWDGVAWSAYVTAESELFEFKGIWGVAADDVWVAGGDPVSREGVVLHWDGSSWSRVDGGGFLPFESIWGFDQNDIWAVGWGSVIAHWDGTSWSDYSYRWYGADLYDVWGSASDNIWAVGLGGSTSYPDGQMLHWDGQTWSSVYVEHNFMRSVWGTALDDVWAVGFDIYSLLDRTVLHWNGIEWTKTPGGTKQHLSDIWGIGNEMWIVGEGGVILNRRQ